MEKLQLGRIFNLSIKTFHSHKAMVVDTSNGKLLVSYNTPVAFYDIKRNVHYLTKYWNFSPTTINQVCRFIGDNIDCHITKANIEKFIKYDANNIREFEWLGNLPRFIYRGKSYTRHK